jgi:protein SCO1/2
MLALPPRFRFRIGGRIQTCAAALVGRPLFWVIALALLSAWPIGWSIWAEQHLPQHRHVIGTVREFSLVDQSAESFGTGILRGRVWVASFASTRCDEVCAAMMERMSNVQHRTRNLGDAFRLVTITVDPDHDTPGRMAEFARRQRPSRHIWHFLTGPHAAVEPLLHDFQVAEKVPQTRFALVDAQLQIRGFYDMSDDESANLLVRDLGLLVSRGN